MGARDRRLSSVVRRQASGNLPLESSLSVHGSLLTEQTKRFRTRSPRREREALAIVAMLEKDERGTHCRRCLPHDACVLDVKLNVILVSKVKKHWRLRALCMPEAQKVPSSFVSGIDNELANDPHSFLP